MLAVLRIQNLAIVEEVEIEFGPDLNVITGETGAGKSIILKAIELLTGKRASSDLIRSGANSATIEGLFHLSPSLISQCKEASDEFEEFAADDELLIRRVIDKSGRTKIYINGSLSTASMLQRIAMPLLDITAQHQQQTLLDPSNHLRLLDSFGVPQKLRTDTAEAYQCFSQARNALDAFKKNAQEQLAHYERIKDEFEKLSEAQLTENEREELEVELSRLGNVERLGENISQCIELIESDDGGIDQTLRNALVLLEQSAELDPTLGESLSLAESASVQLSETKLMLSDYAAGLEASPERLEFIRSRIAEIARLERKFGKAIPELLQYQAEIENEIADFESAGFDEKKLQERLDAARDVLSKLESKLTTERKKTAEKLSKAVEKALSSLNMKKARFRVDVSPCQSRPSGADSVEFTLAANPGEPYRSLTKVASGGELSRILLVLKTLFNEQSSPGTQIFDEIDSGIGGSVAQIVGEKLKRIAEKSQVILVTHAPQIAALGDHHFCIAKTVTKDRTRVQVTNLNTQARIEQVASMLAGKRVTEKFHDSAKELLGLN